jgi:hypothetical protein
MAHTVISTDRTTTATVSSHDVWILNQGISLFPDGAAAGMEGTDVVQAFIQIYGNIVTEFGSATENGITLDGVSDTNQIHVGVGASIFGGAAGIAINGSKNSIGNSGSIDSWGASGMLIAGDENVIVNRGSIEGFGGAIAITGTNNNIINYGTMNTSSTDLDFGDPQASVNINSAEGQTFGLKNHGMISAFGLRHRHCSWRGQ